jgi:hypothetical protein
MAQLGAAWRVFWKWIADSQGGVFAPTAILLAVIGTLWLLLANAPRGPGLTPGIWFDQAYGAVGGKRLLITLLAFFIGGLGAWAFLIGVQVGLVARGQRETLLLFLEGNYLLQSMFVFFGGVIAAVFQLGQPLSFAPIQALVLGATWPSVLSQYISSQASRNSDSERAFEKVLEPAQGPRSAIDDSTAGALIDTTDEFGGGPTDGPEPPKMT